MHHGPRVLLWTHLHFLMVYASNSINMPLPCWNASEIKKLCAMLQHLQLHSEHSSMLSLASALGTHNLVNLICCHAWPDSCMRCIQYLSGNLAGCPHASYLFGIPGRHCTQGMQCLLYVTKLRSRKLQLQKLSCKTRSRHHC